MLTGIMTGKMMLRSQATVILWISSAYMSFKHEHNNRSLKCKYRGYKYPLRDLQKTQFSLSLVEDAIKPFRKGDAWMKVLS